MKHILISRLRYMGDVILTTPAIRAVKEAFPEIHITYLAEAPFHTLIEHHPMVDRVLPFEKPLSRQIPLIRELIGRPYDAAIDLLGNPRSALLTALTGAPMRIGGDFRGRKLLYTHRIGDDGRSKTAPAFHMQYLAPLGITGPASDPVIHLLDEEIRTAGDYLAKHGYSDRSPMVGLHAGATWPAKRWMPGRFAELAERLSARGVQILLTMGPGDRETVGEVIRSCRLPLEMPDVLTLRQLASLINRCDVFVSNDCGPMHIAPAVGTKTVGIFGPGEPEIWFPYDPRKGHRVIHHTIACSRCHQDFCDTMDCMKAVTVEEVFRAVEDAL